MDRRTFCQWMSVGLVANSLPVALAACTSKNAKSEATVDFQEVGTLTQLDQAGQILNAQMANNPVLIVRNPTNPTELVAINPTCTHRDCLVKWSQSEKVFACSCHDSKFDMTGNVLSPPADEPLTLHTVKVEDGRILVKTG